MLRFFAALRMISRPGPTMMPDSPREPHKGHEIFAIIVPTIVYYKLGD